MNEGLKNDNEKACRPELLVPEFISGLGIVLAYGARKYKPNSWQQLVSGRLRYIGAGLRHFLAAISGERNDPETGLSHWLHLGACVMFLFWFDEVATEEQKANALKPYKE